MSLTPPPVRPLVALIHHLPSGTKLWRIHLTAYDAHQFRYILADPLFGGGQFDGTSEDPYPCIYAALSADTVIVETLLRNASFDERSMRTVRRKQVANRILSQVHIQAGLQLIDLRTAAGLASIGAEDKLVNAADTDYPKTRRWAHWLRANNAAAQGIIWHTRRNPGPGNEAVVLFGDRCQENLLKVDERIFLEEAAGAAHLNTVLISHHARIAAPRGSPKLPTTFDHPQLVPSHELVTLSEKSVTAPERAFPAAAEPTIERPVKKNIRVSEPSSQEVHGVNSDKMRSGHGDEYNYDVCLSFAGE
jgi:RES domain